MQLYYSPASPFARKVLVAAHETGLIDRISTVTAQATPVSRDPNVAGQNPLGKIPTLVLDDGSALYDSRVIVDYLDGLHGGAKLAPGEGLERARVLAAQALGDGMMDAAVLVRYETALRPEALRWPDWMHGQLAKVDAALDLLESRAGELGRRFDIGAIAAACALGYLDFRFAERDWRGSRPALAAWFAEVSKRPSVAATAPGLPA